MHLRAYAAMHEMTKEGAHRPYGAPPLASIGIG